MRIQHLFEAIDIAPFYREVQPAIRSALGSAAEAALRLPETDWQGHVQDALRDAVTGVVEGHLAGRLKRRLIVRTKLIRTDADKVVTNTGGNIADFGTGAYMDINIPAEWFDGGANMFWYRVRDNGRRMAEMLTRAIVHETMHLEQKARGEASHVTYDPRSITLGNKGRTAAKGWVGPNDSENIKYLAKKDEIDAQAASAAMEMVAEFGVGRALSMCRSRNAWELLQWAKDPVALPHLNAYYTHVREKPRGRPAWRAFLISLVKHLNAFAVGEEW